jgi:hypothetical protein
VVGVTLFDNFMEIVAASSESLVNHLGSTILASRKHQSYLLYWEGSIPGIPVEGVGSDYT